MSALKINMKDRTAALAFRVQWVGVAVRSHPLASVCLPI